MTDRLRITLAAGAALAALAGCDRAARAPEMNAADLSDDRGARAGRFLSPADNTANAADAAPVDADNGSAR